MGFKLMTNFNRPYFARNISEFWKRWHISLSTWFRDYLYISLGGSRVSIPRWYLNLFIVFLISGLWHGANWTFIIWGSLNGFYLVFAIISQNLRAKIVNLSGLNKIPRLHLFLQIFITFILSCFAWIFFRANNFSDSILIIKKIFTSNGQVFYDHADPSSLFYAFLGIFMLILIEFKKEYYNSRFTFFNSENWLVRNLSYAALILIILSIGVFDGGQFIYFQF
jgi:D-alanyl-lipoteichoic acid acyltransferase DltB (MBOAT superfamily)